MSRENAQAKGRRYVGEGRLVLTALGPRSVAGTCRGDGAVYRLGWTPARGWWCTCPAKTDRCAHLSACRLVTAVDLEDR